MAKYQLVVKNVINNKSVSIKIKSKNSSQITDKVSLYEIDALTSSYENKQHFLNALKASKCIDFDYGEIYIEYNYRGIRRLEPIYNDKLLKKSALAYLNNKKDISLINGYNEFVKKLLKDIMTEKSFNKIIYNPNMNYMLKDKLLDYKELCFKNSYTVQEIQDLKYLEKDIYRFINNYRVLRQLKTIYNSKIIYNDLSKHNNLKLQKENRYQNRKIEPRDYNNTIDVYERNFINKTHTDREEFLSEHEIMLMQEGLPPYYSEKDYELEEQKEEYGLKK